MAIPQGTTSRRISVKPKPRKKNLKLIGLRVNAGLSPNELGDEVGCSGKFIRDIEKGCVPAPRIQLSIAEFFDLTPLEIWPLRTQRAVRA